MPIIIIRTATEQDLNELACLFDAYRQFYEYQPDIELARQFMRDRLIKNDAVILMAENEKKDCIGFCQLYPTFCSLLAKPIYTLYDLFVSPGNREQGIGHQLLIAAQERAVADGKSRVDLTTAKTNFKAQSLYQALGWEKDEIFYTYAWFSKE